MSRFPTKSSMILITSEVIVRMLGLLFATRLLLLFGAKTTTEFRMLLPMLTVGLAFTTTGIPQALTRLIANYEGRKRPYSLCNLLLAAWVQAGLWAALFIFVLFEMNRGRIWQPPWSPLQTDTLVLLSVLTLVLSMNGPLRGVLFGVGNTVLPAIASVLDIVVRLTCVTVMSLVPTKAVSLNTMLLMTLSGEAAILLFFTFTFRLKTSSVSSTPYRSAEHASPFHIFRLAMGSTVQAMVAGLGYAVELPLAMRLLNQSSNPADSVQTLAAYALVGIPVLCTPMVITDSVATALLPSAARNLFANSTLLGHYLNHVLRIVLLVAGPFVVTMWLGAPDILSWFGLKHGTSLLSWLAPSAIPLYLQAPLAALLLARGQTRHVILAGILSDGCRIFVLWLCIHQFRMTGNALPTAFGISTVIYTTVLLFRMKMYVKVTIPWRTLWHAGQSVIILAAILLVSLHSQRFNLQAHPFAWSFIALVAVLGVYHLNGEIALHRAHNSETREKLFTDSSVGKYP